ncbi:MAG: AbrB/MazE/SpoVT family DNA-binding domain-containing protein [Candidatus Diapherotrites archaeon]|nr:AbrB/MazE/SpoVT family DNA-binding domain-containing protein [Candidatus Diapherotrites archaeon]
MKKKAVSHSCTECGGKMAYVEDIKFRGYLLEGLRCKKCGEEEMDLEQVGGIVRLERMKKKETLMAKAYKSGNSMSLRIPMALAKAFGIEPGEELPITTKGHTIEILA